MPRTKKVLLQIQLSAEERLRIRSLALTQGLTLRSATLQAFAAWEEKIHNRSAAPAAQPKSAPPDPQEPSGSWLQRAAKLDWTKCPEVEIIAGKNRRLWVLTGTLAPLTEVLGGAAAGHPIGELAEAYQVPLPQLTKVLQFAGAAARAGR